LRISQFLVAAGTCMLGMLGTQRGAIADQSRSKGIHLLYAENKAVCGSVLTYLQRIDRLYPRKTPRERLLLEDVFIDKYRPLLPKDLSVPVPVESSDFGNPPDEAPHHALYSVVLDPVSGVQRLIAIHDPASGSGEITSNLYLFKPGTDRAGLVENDRPASASVANSIPHRNNTGIYGSADLGYFFEKIYSDADRRRPLDWRIYHHLFVSSASVLRLFVWNSQYFILAGTPLFNTGIVFKITATGDFDDTCYFNRTE
jgi:hypothetical protein